MNSIGQMWRAFDLMAERALTREVHGGLLKDKQFVQGFIADSYIDIQAARLMTIHAAEKVDQGLQAARTDISAIKIAVPARSEEHTSELPSLIRIPYAVLFLNKQ